MEANQYLNDFYNHYDEDSRLLFQHGSVEFLTTMRYIEKYLKHGDKVLEIGAGTGRYSHALARRGHPWTRWSWSRTTSRFSAKTPVLGKRHHRTGQCSGSVRLCGQRLRCHASARPALSSVYAGRQAPGAAGGDPRHKAGRRCLCRLCHLRRLPSGRGLPPRQYLCCRICAGRAAGRPDVCRQLPAKGFVRAGAQRGC